MQEYYNTQYPQELETFITRVLLPRYLELCEKYSEPVAYNLIPQHLLLLAEKVPNKTCRLLQAEFRI